MSPKELGEKTLITKGTLTGVIDRLVDKKMVRRAALLGDRRYQVIRLTAQGEKLFARVFPAHLGHLERALAGFSPGNLAGRMAANLRLLRTAFERQKIQEKPDCGLCRQNIRQ